VIPRLVVNMDAMAKSGETSLDVANNESGPLYHIKLPLWPSRSIEFVLSILVELKINGYVTEP
jgi:hypothetical protein